MAYSKNYLAWVKEEQQRCLERREHFQPLTRNQYEFAEFCFSNWETCGKIGNMSVVFDSISFFIKHSDNFKKPRKSKWWHFFLKLVPKPKNNKQK